MSLKKFDETINESLWQRKVLKIIFLKELPI
jgi:hypothetical protein